MFGHPFTLTKKYSGTLSFVISCEKIHSSLFALNFLRHSFAISFGVRFARFFFFGFGVSSPATCCVRNCVGVCLCFYDFLTLMHHCNEIFVCVRVCVYVCVCGERSEFFLSCIDNSKSLE